MNEDKYPTKAELKFIREFECVKKPVGELIDYIERIWWASEWGFKVKDGKDILRKKCKILELHTGGWSGNEDIMRALQKNKWFEMFYWQESRRGGHYKYEISMGAWKR